MWNMQCIGPAADSTQRDNFTGKSRTAWVHELEVSTRLDDATNLLMVEWANLAQRVFRRSRIASRSRL